MSGYGSAPPWQREVADSFDFIAGKPRRAGADPVYLHRTVGVPVADAPPYVRGEKLTNAESRQIGLVPTPVHEYLSTACLHGEHDYCAATLGVDLSPKSPKRCKWCAAPCVCECHEHQP